MPTCLTIDVEDWYDGMAELGHALAPVESGPSGLEALRRLLLARPECRVTLFVVGKYAAEVGPDLRQLAEDGHEMASHGPDHGRLPEDATHLEDWLRRGREMVEEVVEVPVVGFRSPRFDVPESMGLDKYREILARAGFTYVSDRHCSGAGSPVKELDVFRWHGLPMGGGSYQRLLPTPTARALVERTRRPAVLYYHSYDFGVNLPSPWSARSPAVLKQVIGRRRIPTIFDNVLRSVGSVSCEEAARAV